MNLIVFDADGTVIDSRAAAWQATERILATFGKTVSIASPEDMEAAFGRAAQHALVGKRHASALRMMHRLLMRHQSQSLPLFEEILEVVAQLDTRRVLITGALADGIATCLGPRARLFSEIVGFETGRKPELLTRLKGRAAAYVTDTVADIRICKPLGLRTIACSWGYDGRRRLKSECPDFIVDDATELQTAINVCLQQKEKIRAGT